MKFITQMKYGPAIGVGAMAGIIALSTSWSGTFLFFIGGMILIASLERKIAELESRISELEKERNT
ncbi:hypothetical protein FZW96_07585 [Bacillus sp. BGMRC 2118]|nr:hypothetical protein FZW96_07585 [Bacillus sp. BGMRC 2118]